MTHTCTLLAPTGSDAYGAVQTVNYGLRKVNIQPTHSVVKSRDDKEVRLNAVLFYAPRLSSPYVDFSALQSRADEANAQMKVVYGGLTYTVETVDLLPDDEGRLHHVELGLV